MFLTKLRSIPEIDEATNCRVLTCVARTLLTVTCNQLRYHFIRDYYFTAVFNYIIYISLNDTLSVD